MIKEEIEPFKSERDKINDMYDYRRHLKRVDNIIIMYII